MGRKTNVTTLQNGAKLQVAFDYLSLKLGNGRTITAGRSGERATGDVPDAVFESFTKMVASGEGSLGEKMPKWAEEVLPVLWPSWAVAPPTPSVGDTVTKDFGHRRSRWSGKMTGVIEKAPRRKTGRYNVRFEAGLMGMTAGEIAQAGA